MATFRTLKLNQDEFLEANNFFCFPVKCKQLSRIFKKFFTNISMPKEISPPYLMLDFYIKKCNMRCNHEKL